MHWGSWLLSHLRGYSRHLQAARPELLRPGSLSGFLAVTLCLAPMLTGADASSSATRLTLELRTGDDVSSHQLILSETTAQVYSSAGILEAVYSAQSDTLQITDQAANTSTEINRESASALAAQLRAEIQEMEDSLSTLPPEQEALSRLRMRQLFKRPEPHPTMPAMSTMPTMPTVDAFIATGQEDTLQGISCTVYTLLQGSATVGSACLADPAQIQNGNTLQAMLTLATDLYLMLRTAAPDYVAWVLPENPILTLQPEYGIPLQMTLHNEEGLTTSALRVTDIRDAELLPGTLE